MDACPAPPPAGTVFDPTLDEYVSSVDSVVAEGVKLLSGLPRVLYSRQFREYVQDLPTDVPGALGAPTVGGLIAQSVDFQGIRRDIDAKFAADFAAATAYVRVFDAVRPVFDFHLSNDDAAYRAREQTVHSLQRDMARMKAWDLQVDRMRSQHVEGALFVDSKKLKSELEPIMTSAIDNIKALLSDLARKKCRAVTEAFASRSRTLDQRPPALDKFAAHVERIVAMREAEAALLRDAAAVEDMYKLLQSYDVKVTSEDSVSLDDMRNAGIGYTDSYRKSETYLEERMPEMTRQLDMNIIKATDSLKAVGESVNDGAFVDPSQAPEAVLEMLEVVKARFAALQDTAERYNKWQGLFGIPPFEFRQLKTAQKSLNQRVLLWQTSAQFDSKYRAWTDGPFEAVDAEELARDVAGFLKTSFVLDKQVRQPPRGVRHRDSCHGTVCLPPPADRRRRFCPAQEARLGIQAQRPRHLGPRKQGHARPPLAPHLRGVRAALCARVAHAVRAYVL